MSVPWQLSIFPWNRPFLSHLLLYLLYYYQYIHSIWNNLCLTDTYGKDTRILYTNRSERDILPMIYQINQSVFSLRPYDGNQTDLLSITPHMAVINIDDYDKRRMNVTITYNDTMQHSLPILMNILSNAYYR